MKFEIRMCKIFLYGNFADQSDYSFSFIHIFFLELPYVGRLIIINHPSVSLYTWCIVRIMPNYKLEIYHQIIDKQSLCIHICIPITFYLIKYLSSSYIKLQDVMDVACMLQNSLRDNEIFLCSCRILVSFLPVLKSI